MLKRITGLIAGVVVPLAAGMGSTALARSLEDIIASGTLCVGTYADQPPMASLNNDNAYEGFDIDAADHIAGP